LLEKPVETFHLFCEYQAKGKAVLLLRVMVRPFEKVAVRLNLVILFLQCVCMLEGAVAPED